MVSHARKNFMRDAFEAGHKVGAQDNKAMDPTVKKPPVGVCLHCGRALVPTVDHSKCGGSP
jgi:hypothetical protein